MTLLELLVAVAVAGLLAGLALPGYRAQVMRAHRFEAMGALLAVAEAQERHHLAEGRYAAWLADDAGRGDAPALALPARTTGGRYVLSITEATPGRFRAVARPLAGRGQDRDARCAEFAIEATGRRSARDSEGRDTTPDCWR